MNWFERETALARSEGVSHSGNLPFLLAPQNPNGRALLLVHGFSSSPKEMLPLGEALVKHDFTVYGVRLPGHGTTPDDLAGRSTEEWFSTVLQSYHALVKLGLTVSAAGLSTGALLCLKLALAQPLERLILLSPFLKLRHRLAPYAGLLSAMIPYQNKNIPPEEQPFYYQQRPLKGISQINRLRKELRGQLNRIVIPTLVLAAEGDATIAPGTAQELFQQLGGQPKLYHCYGPEVPHVLLSTENPRLQDVLLRCLRFLAATAPPTVT